MFLQLPPLLKVVLYTSLSIILSFSASNSTYHKPSLLPILTKITESYLECLLYLFTRSKMIYPLEDAELFVLQKSLHYIKSSIVSQ